MKLLNNKTELSPKKISYLLYAFRSLSVDLRSYTVLFLSLVCMIVMSCNIIIYNASLCKGENETVIKNYGEYHLLTENVNESSSLKIDQLDYVERSYNVCVLADIKNTNTSSALDTAKLAIHKKDMTGLYVNVINGVYPGIDEVMISQKTARAFSLTLGDTVDVELYYGNEEKSMSFPIVGIYDGCEEVDDYIFLNEETGAAIQDYDQYYLFCIYDKFILFNTDFKPYINKYTDEVLGMTGNTELKDENGFSIRTDFLNNKYVDLEEFYEKPGFLITVLLSIIPAAVCIFVFSVLDVTKSMKELSTLSMIGTTSKQFFMILISKYSVIYAAAFPVGFLISSILMFLLILFSSGLNTVNEVYISYTVSFPAVLILFIFCYLILSAVTFFVAKNTSSTSYSDSLSVMKDMDNVFVRSTSAGILKPKGRKTKLGLIFSARNRKVNLMFSVVVGVIFSVFIYFALVISQSMGNTVLDKDTADYSFEPDKMVSSEVDFLSDQALSDLKNFSFTDRLDLSYIDRSAVKIFIEGDKHISKPQTSSIKTIEKLYTTDILLFSEGYERAEAMFGEYVVSGNLMDVYEKGQVALFVHTWNDSNEYFHAGDTVRLSTPRTDSRLKNHTLGAVIYIKNDEYENIDVVRLLVNSDTFTKFTDQKQPQKAGICLSDNVQADHDEIEKQLLNICKENSLVMTNEYELNEAEKEKMQSSVVFYSILGVSVLIILIIMPFALTKFLLESRKNTIRTFHMIGTSRYELLKIFGVEFIISGALSCLSGSILSAIVYFAYRGLSNLTYTAFYFNSFTTVFMLCSYLAATVVCITVPFLSSYHYFSRGQYNDI